MNDFHAARLLLVRDEERRIRERLSLIDYKIKDRSAKLEKKKRLMPLNGRGLKSIILPLLGKKAKDSK